MLCRGGKGLSRAVQRTRRRRPVGGHTPVGLAAVGGSTAVAGVLGTAAAWVVGRIDWQCRRAAKREERGAGPALWPRRWACEREVLYQIGVALD
jgi:hypothetical protein